jgi:subtilisin family serine protease
MATPTNPALDPRLRRMTRAVQEPQRRANELRGAGLTNALRETEPETLVTDVLVLVGGEPPVDAVPGTRWTPVGGGVYAVEVPVAELESLAALPQVQYVEASRRLTSDLVTSVPATGADRLHRPDGATPGLTGVGVVVGIIDSWLDFTLDDFINAEGNTRVAYLWDQSLVPQDGEHAPAEFGIGVEYDATAIATALKADDPFSVVRHRMEPATHGTHVAGIAVGNGRSHDATFPAGRYIGTAPEATIVFVRPDTRDQPGVSLTHTARVAMAVRYIYARAAQLGLPCVINMSLSQSGGGHDGQSLVERVIDFHLEERPGRSFVHAAANRQTERIHASGTLTTGAVRILHWQVNGGDGGTPDPTANELEIWCSPRDDVRVRLIDPHGETTPAFEADERHEIPLGGGDTVTVETRRFSPLNGQTLLYVAVEPADGAPVTPGVWQLELSAVRARDGRFDAWIERDNTKHAQQSFFVGADYDPVMTLGTPSTTRLGVTVANYDHHTDRIAPSSSRGPTRDGRSKPDIAAPGTAIVSSCSLGGRPGEDGNPIPVRIEFSGTSMAAPHVTGIVALLLQRHPTLTAAQIRAVLPASASPAPGVTGFDIAWGFGRIDAVAALALLG